MKIPRLPKRIPDDIIVGKKATFRRTLTEADVALFIGVTWDINPYHTDEEFAKETSFKQRIVPGLLTGSMLTHIGGLWAFLATEMSFEFLAPVFVGDTIIAEAEIFQVDHQTGQVQLLCRSYNASGKDVLRGKIIGFPGNFE